MGVIRDIAMKNNNTTTISYEQFENKAIQNGIKKEIINEFIKDYEDLGII